MRADVVERLVGVWRGAGDNDGAACNFEGPDLAGFELSCIADVEPG